MIKIKDTKVLKSNNRVYYSPEENEKKVYNTIKLELQNKLNIKLRSRDEIIKKVISFLTQGDYQDFSTIQMDLTIIRTDIKNFFPSINKHKLYQKINNQNILKKDSMDILKEFIFNNKIEGVPLGLGFSNHLAEFYLAEFDSDLKKAFIPELFFRYVDDIIIISYSERLNCIYEDEEAIRNKLDDIMRKYNLERNDNKTEIKIINKFKEVKSKNKPKKNKSRNVVVNEKHKEALKKKEKEKKKQRKLDKRKFIEDNSFNFLGYKFTIYNKKLIIGMALEKQIKVLKKIQIIFKTFKKNPSNIEYWKMYYKLMNVIYGITSFNTKNKKFKFGLGYNYRYINDPMALKPFLSAVRKSVYSCNLSSNKKNNLLYLINYDSPLDVLKRRFNYLNLTDKQKEIIMKRLDLKIVLPTKANFSRILFYKLYQN